MSTPHEESRPRQKDGPRTPATKSVKSLPLGRTPEEEARLSELATFLGRCRRLRDDAGHRLPPLPDGRRDPLRAPTDGTWYG